LISKKHIGCNKQTILSESESITKLIDLLDENFADGAVPSFERQISVTGIGERYHCKKMGMHLICGNTILFFTHLKSYFSGTGCQWRTLSV
jgi:hypothetical protein